MSEETNTPPADTGATEQQPAETIVGMPASDIIALGTAGDVVPAALLETLTGGVGADVVEVVDYTAMTAPEMLSACRDDAAKWAAAFCQTAAKLGVSQNGGPLDEGWMIGWFANAIEHSGAVRRWSAEEAAAGPLRVAHDAIEALLGCATRLRVLDRLEPDTHAKATGALADLKASLGL